jgi:hypothetical protein
MAGEVGLAGQGGPAEDGEDAVEAFGGPVLLGTLRDLDATSRTARPKWRSRRSRPEDIPRMITLFLMIRVASDAVNGGIRDPYRNARKY